MQHLVVEGAGLVVVATLAGPTRHGQQVVGIRLLHQQRDGFRFLTCVAQALRAGHQQVALQPGAEFAHRITPAFARQLFQHLQCAGITVCTRQVQPIGIQRFGVLPLAAHQLLEAVVRRTGLVDLPLRVGQSVGEPRLVRGQGADFAQEGHHARPVLAGRGRIGLLVQLIELKAATQPGEFLLAGGGQAVEKGLGFVRGLRAVQPHQRPNGAAVTGFKFARLEQQRFSLNVIELTTGDRGQPDQGIGIPGSGFTRLFKCAARGGVVFAIQRLVALTEQHQIVAGVHQVLPLAHV